MILYTFLHSEYLISLNVMKGYSGSYGSTKPLARREKGSVLEGFLRMMLIILKTLATGQATL